MRRQWAAAAGGQGGGGGVPFRVLSFNTLAESLAFYKRYRHCPLNLLKWPMRGWNIAREIRSHNADIICLQEVDETSFPFFEGELEQDGYLGYYAKHGGGRRDGIATFWKRERFALVEVSRRYLLEDTLMSKGQAVLYTIFRDLAPQQHPHEVCLSEAYVESCQPVCSASARGHCFPESGGIHEDAYSSPDTSQTTAGDPLHRRGAWTENPHIVVANVHMIFDPLAGDVKFAQLCDLALCAWAFFKKYSNGGLAPPSSSSENSDNSDDEVDVLAPNQLEDVPAVLFCGDFNFSPQSSLYQYLFSRMIDFDEYPHWDSTLLSGQYLLMAGLHIPETSGHNGAGSTLPRLSVPPQKEAVVTPRGRKSTAIGNEVPGHSTAGEWLAEVEKCVDLSLLREEYQYYYIGVGNGPWRAPHCCWVALSSAKLRASLQRGGRGMGRPKGRQQQLSRKKPVHRPLRDVGSGSPNLVSGGGTATSPPNGGSSSSCYKKGNAGRRKLSVKALAQSALALSSAPTEGGDTAAAEPAAKAVDAEASSPMRKKSVFRFPFELRSAYRTYDMTSQADDRSDIEVSMAEGERCKGVEPASTAFHGWQTGCIDYIWHSARTTKCVGILELPSPEELQRFGNTPNEGWPSSDHFSLVAEFVLTGRRVRARRNAPTSPII